MRFPGRFEFIFVAARVKSGACRDEVLFNAQRAFTQDFNMKILVVGGAGYIGSHMIKMLYRKGHMVVTFDNLSTGYRDAVKYGKFVQGDIGDSSKLDAVFSAFEL